MSAPNEFRFKNIHPRLFIGTASDRYAGWVGQIYSGHRYRGRIISRPKQVGGRSYVEEVLPVDSVREYFDHFPVLEIDFTFYGTLLDVRESPTSNFRVLTAYRKYLEKGDRVVLKVPQTVFAPKVRRGSEYVDNDDYLDADIFMGRFLDPAVRILGSNLSGLVFEQEYQRREERPDPEDFAADLDVFFGSIPSDGRYHVEIRTGDLLQPPLMEVLGRHGVGLVLSHWTWLPPLRAQHGLIRSLRLNRERVQVIRLVTPRGMTYAQTYKAAHPFSDLVEGMMSGDMIEDTVEVIKGEVSRGTRVFLLINNRAGGNAPLIARLVSERFLSPGDEA